MQMLQLDEGKKGRGLRQGSKDRRVLVVKGLKKTKKTQEKGYREKGINSKGKNGVSIMQEINKVEKQD